MSIVATLPLLAAPGVPPGDAPLVVHVDASFDEKTPGWQVDRFDSVQDGVDAVVTGGLVVITQVPGPSLPFQEAVVVDRPMVLEGDGSLWPGTIDGTGLGAALTIAAEGVTVRELALLHGGPSPLAALRVEAGGNAFVDNTIDGSLTGAAVEAGADGNLFRGNTFHGSQHGLGLGSSWNRVEANAFFDQVTQDVSISGSHNLVVGNTIESAIYTGIGVFGPDNVISGNVIANQAKCINVFEVPGTQIVGNSFSDSTYACVETRLAVGTVIEDNTFEDWSFAALNLAFSSQCVVSGNVFGPHEAGRPIYLVDCPAATITDNVLANGGILLDAGFDFSLDGLGGHTIANNTSGGRAILYYDGVVGPLTVPADAAQVFLAGCSDVTVAGQTFEDVPMGLVASHSSGLVVEDSLAARCDYGIVLFETVDSLVAGNEIADCGRGVSLRYGGANTFEGNLFAANSAPVEMGPCPATPNTLQLNTFVGNDSVGGDCGDEWDGGPLVGGNFYDAYDGVDADGDGFGDAPFAVGNETDDYPLVAPAGGPLLWSEAFAITAGAGDVYPLRLEAGTPSAGRPYFVLAGFSGSFPGQPLPGGVILPVNFDALTLLVATSANTLPFSDFAGALSGDGSATAHLVLPPLASGVVGLEMTLAYALVDALDVVSGPLVLPIVP